jgi:hypothetical protein
MDVDKAELMQLLRSLAVGLEDSTRILMLISDLHNEAASLHAQVTEAAVDLEEMLKRLEARAGERQHIGEDSSG